MPRMWLSLMDSRTVTACMKGKYNNKLNKWLILAKLGKSSKSLTHLLISGCPEDWLKREWLSWVCTTSARDCWMTWTRAPINLCMVSLFLASLELLPIFAIDWTLHIYSEHNMDITGMGYMLACLEWLCNTKHCMCIIISISISISIYIIIYIKCRLQLHQ